MRKTLFTLTLLFFSFSLPLAPFAGGGSGDGAPSYPQHWERPVVIAGSGTDIKPYPEECAECHPSKFNDWKGSLHSGSVSPGLTAQLDPHSKPDFAVSCYYCHAPLLAQSEVISSGGGYSKNPLYDKRLQHSGVSCAACHLRQGVIVGPGVSKKLKGKSGHPTGVSELFKSSEFCAACHQLDRGFELNGKVLTNTYNEWKMSPYAEREVTCQVCHMPNGSHLFRGIHDREMVLKGLDIKIMRVPAIGGVKAALMITNARIGHMFPTYVTPIVVLKAFLVDEGGKALEESEEKAFIGRLVSQDLKTEYFDTRLAPFETFKFNFESKDSSGADKLIFEVTVRPDEFYDRLFRRASKDRLSGFKEKELGEALKGTQSSSYLLYRKELSLKD